MTEQMIKKINEEINVAKLYYDLYKENDQRTLAKVRGMIEILSSVTGKEYLSTENGLMEK